jgi:hypothetical protein
VQGRYHRRKWQHVNPYGTFTLKMHERLPLQQVTSSPLPLLCRPFPFVGSKGEGGYDKGSAGWMSWKQLLAQRKVQLL